MQKLKNLVSTRTAKVTTLGSFGEMQATGKEVEIEGLIIDCVVNGRVAKRWELWDQMEMMQQLGSFEIGTFPVYTNYLPGKNSMPNSAFKKSGLT